MSEKWLRPFKLLEHYTDPHFGDMETAERQLYSAVTRGEVRIRHNGKPLALERLKQFLQTRPDDRSPFELPPDIELSTEDVERVLGETFGIDAAKGH